MYIGVGEVSQALFDVFSSHTTYAFKVFQGALSATAFFFFAFKFLKAHYWRWPR